MAEGKALFQDQLGKTCKLTQANWAACFQHNAGAWVFQVGYRMTKALRTSLEGFIQQPSPSRWVAGALSNGRTRSRATGDQSTDLACDRIFVFPNALAQSVLLIGADQLEQIGIGFFRVLAKGIPEGGFGSLPREADIFLRPFELGSEVSYNFQDTLTQVLTSVASYMNGQAAYLAVRRGDMFRIEAIWECAAEARGLQVQIGDNPLLQDFALNGEAQIINKVRRLGDLVPKGCFPNVVRTWMGVPLVLGNRVIALLVFVSYKRSAFSTADLNQAVRFARLITPSVENAIAFAEAGRHLQRLALLNELASAASAGLEIDQVAGRVVRMLRRTFRTDLITLLMLSSDELSLREYGQEAYQAASNPIPLENNLAGFVVKTELPLRIDDVRKAPKEIPINPEVRSELAVPLKYRGRVNGVLNLGSLEPNAFSLEDEQLLVVIASHLAGLLENVRLSEESRIRARNLGMIHRVIQRVVGLINLDEIARVSAALMAEQFGYELATVVLLDENDENLIVRGVGGAMGHLVSHGAQIGLQELN